MYLSIPFSKVVLVHLQHHRENQLSDVVREVFQLAAIRRSVFGQGH
jgi:hypothetical protein